MKKYGLFEAFGIEIEYMIVRPGTLEVLPCADEILGDFAESGASEFNSGDLTWSNELVNHVIELKTATPVKSLTGLEDVFQNDIRLINKHLSGTGGCLLPGGMHPFMDPGSETVIWKHGDRAIYEAYDRIFGCSGHGWSNLQSVHLNLPFKGDREFAALHSAVRIVLPLVPAVAASSPLRDGAPAVSLDERLEVYRLNQSKIPEITGHVIPEPVFSREEYQKVILEPMYRAIAPFDTEGILAEEWLNSRGAIARFDRDAIELRLADTQECPRMDMAVASFCAHLARALVEGRFCGFAAQRSVSTGLLTEILSATIRDASHAVIDEPDYLELFGVRGQTMSAAELIPVLSSRLADFYPDYQARAGDVEFICREGTLSERIIRSLKGDSPRDGITAVYRRMADCLETGTRFEG